MSAYENIFTQVEVWPEKPEEGVEPGRVAREKQAVFFYLLGLIGNAQIGPIYLGTLGVVSALFGFMAFEIIGLNMLASVHWSPIEFVRQLPWLALEPPKPEYGIGIAPLATAAGGRSPASSSPCLS